MTKNELMGRKTIAAVKARSFAMMELSNENDQLKAMVHACCVYTYEGTAGVMSEDGADLISS